MSFPSDLEIARSVTPRPIIDVARDLGIADDELELYGPTKAKVTLDGDRAGSRPSGRAASTCSSRRSPRRRSARASRTTSVGLAQGLNHIGKKAAVNIRQPSLGPVFGIKGGAAGGGYSQVIPMEDFNLHLTGDVHAIGAAHNLAGAFLDNSLHHKNPLGIDIHGILWPRVLDISDRALRHVVIGLGGREDGIPRETEFVITVGSEVMAVLALATDLFDLRARLGRIVLATTTDGKAVTAEDLGVAGAMTVLLRDAIKPNLLQTLEGGPAFVHAGPFANIAHGNNSIIADRLALVTNEIVCTEAGFGADMGAEKFFDIKCRASGLSPDAAVVVATVRALKMHGGVGKIVAGKPLDPALLEENVEAVRRGAAEPGQADRERDDVRDPGGRRDQLVPDRHAGRGRGHPRGRARGGRARRRRGDALRRRRGRCRRAGRGGLGGDRGRATPSSSCSIRTRCPSPRRSRRSPDAVYGADGVEFLPSAAQVARAVRGPGLRGSCRSAWPRRSTRSATTPASRAARPGSRSRSARSGCRPGAGFITPLCGEMRTMPGLPSRPGGEKIDIDADGNIVGLF